MRRNFLTLGFLFVLFMTISQVSHAQDLLGGSYFGVRDAEGARIEIAPDEAGFRGVFHDPAGKSQSFEADPLGAGAEAVLDMDGQTVLMRMAPVPYGAEVEIIPIAPEGQLDFAASRDLTFLRDGLSLPELPEDYVDPPQDARGRIAANSFLASYAFWPPEGALNGYLSLPSRFQRLMSLFPAVQLDVIFKLCLSGGAENALAIALRGQSVTCPGVIEGMANAQRRGTFAEFKAQVAAEAETLRLAIRCADGYVVSKAECDSTSIKISRQAVSTETAATVLRRYR